MNKLNKIILEEFIHLNEKREIFNHVFHGTSNSGAKDILKNGVNISKSTGGYFGWGFYTAIDYDLAKNNYAEFAGDNDIDEKGVILEFKINPNANILDLRDENDWEIWKNYAKYISNPNLYKELIRNGIDGLYDNSFGGVILYNPKVLELIKAHELN